MYHVAGHSRSETISRDILYDDFVGASTSLCGEAFKRIGGYNVSNLESVVLRSCGNSTLSVRCVTAEPKGELLPSIIPKTISATSEPFV